MSRYVAPPCKLQILNLSPGQTCRTFHRTMFNIDVLRKFDSFDHLVRWWKSCSKMFDVVWRSSKTSPNFSIVLNVRWNVVCVWPPCQTFRRTISFIFTFLLYPCDGAIGHVEMFDEMFGAFDHPRSNFEKFWLFFQLQCSVKCSARLTGALHYFQSSNSAIPSDCLKLFKWDVIRRHQ